MLLGSLHQISQHLAFSSLMYNLATLNVLPLMFIERMQINKTNLISYQTNNLFFLHHPGTFQHPICSEVQQPVCDIWLHFFFFQLACLGHSLSIQYKEHNLKVSCAILLPTFSTLIKIHNYHDFCTLNFSSPGII